MKMVENYRLFIEGGSSLQNLFSPEYNHSEWNLFLLEMVERIVLEGDRVLFAGPAELVPTEIVFGFESTVEKFQGYSLA